MKFKNMYKVSAVVPIKAYNSMIRRLSVKSYKRQDSHRRIIFRDKPLDDNVKYGVVDIMHMGVENDIQLNNMDLIPEDEKDTVNFEIVLVDLETDLDTIEPSEQFLKWYHFEGYLDDISEDLSYYIIINWLKMCATDLSIQKIK